MTAVISVKGDSNIDDCPNATVGGSYGEQDRAAAPRIDGARADSRPPGVSPGLTLFAALLGFVMIALDASVVNVALPAIGRGLGGSTAGLQWIADAYTLMFAALLLSAGAFSDRVGASRLYAAGAASFTVASAACGLAPRSILIGARLVQGSAAARGKAIAQWTMAGAAATALGSVVGGADE